MFVAAHAQDDHWSRAVDGCLKGLSPQSAQANLGFVYISDRFAAEVGDILARLRSETGVLHWVGTVGLGICGTGVEFHDQAAISILLAALPADAFRVVSAGTGAGFDLSPAHQAWNQSAKPYLAVVHGDPAADQLEARVRHLSESMDSGFLVGGLSSSRTLRPQVADGLVSGGLSGVLLTRAVPMSIRVTQSCVPIGPRHRITGCQDNVLVELDGRPALEVFQEEIGEVLSRDLSKVAGFIFAGFPVRGTDTGDYLVRNLLGVDEENELLVVDERLVPGEPMHFCRRDAASAREDLERMLGDLKEGLSGPPKGGLYYSCIARGASLFGEQSEEVRTIHAALGDFPLAGFFGAGEISNHRLYSYTGVLALFL